MIDVVFARTTTITMAETKNKARIKASWGLSTKKLTQRPDTERQQNDDGRKEMRRGGKAGAWMDVSKVGDSKAGSKFDLEQ